MKILNPRYSLRREGTEIKLSEGYVVFTNQNNASGPDTILLNGIHSDLVSFLVHLTDKKISFQNTGKSAILWPSKNDPAQAPSFIPMDPQRLYFMEIGSEADIVIPAVNHAGQWIIAHLHFESKNQNCCYVHLKI